MRRCATGGQSRGESEVDKRKRGARETPLVAGHESFRRQLVVDEARYASHGHRVGDELGRRRASAPIAEKLFVQ